MGGVFTHTFGGSTVIRSEYCTRLLHRSDSFFLSYASSGKVAERRVHVRPGELLPTQRGRRAAAPATLLVVVGGVRRVLVAVPTAAASATAAATADVGRLVDPGAREDGGDLGGLLGAEHRRRRPRGGGGGLGRVVAVAVMVPRRRRRRVVVGEGVAVAVHPVEVGGGGAVVDDLQSAKWSRGMLCRVRRAVQRNRFGSIGFEVQGEMSDRMAA